MILFWDCLCYRIEIIKSENLVCFNQQSLTLLHVYSTILSSLEAIIYEQTIKVYIDSFASSSSSSVYAMNNQTCVISNFIGESNIIMKLDV